MRNTAPEHFSLEMRWCPERFAAENSGARGTRAPESPKHCSISSAGMWLCLSSQQQAHTGCQVLRDVATQLLQACSWLAQVWGSDPFPELLGWAAVELSKQTPGAQRLHQVLAQVWSWDANSFAPCAALQPFCLVRNKGLCLVGHEGSCVLLSCFC